MAAVGAGCVAAAYSLSRNLITNPDVHITSATRSDVLPENDIQNQRAAGYKNSFYRTVQKNKDNTKIFG